jgi:hypothetical protein
MKVRGWGFESCTVSVLEIHGNQCINNGSDFVLILLISYVTHKFFVNLNLSLIILQCLQRGSVMECSKVQKEIEKL